MARKKATRRKQSPRKQSPRKKTSSKRKRTWTKVTFEELDSWRAARGIPKKRMAEMLGVTNSTYHNWARGIAVATPNTQERIRRVLAGEEATAATPGQGPPARCSAEVMSATGQIVNSYLQTRPSGMTPEKLVELVRQVRSALTS
ncbi:MAG: XRE family transcriptional regulator [Planctomycetota bacterium]|nr:MAG: XRE family transcriptional regulator [Planctomycetota bacterium]